MNWNESYYFGKNGNMNRRKKHWEETGADAGDQNNLTEGKN
jgi:hypothetical protein